MSAEHTAQAVRSEDTEAAAVATIEVAAPTIPAPLPNSLGLDIDTLKANILALQVRGNGATLSEVSNDEGKRFLDKEVKRALKEMAGKPELLFNKEASNAHFKKIAATAVQTICTTKGYYASQGSFQKLGEGSLPALNLDVATIRQQMLAGFPGAGGITLDARITPKGKEALDKNLSATLLAIATTPALFDKNRANEFFAQAVANTGTNLNANPELAIKDAELVRQLVTKPVSKLLVGTTASRETRRAVTTALTPFIEAALRTTDGGNLLNTVNTEGLNKLNADLATELGKVRNFLVTPSEKANTNTFLVGEIRIGDDSVAVTPSELYTTRKIAQHHASLDTVRLAHLAEVAPEVNADLAAAKTARDTAVQAKAELEKKAEAIRIAAEKAAQPSWFARTFRGGAKPVVAAPAVETGRNSPFNDPDASLLVGGTATGVAEIVRELEELANRRPGEDKESPLKTAQGGDASTFSPASGEDRSEEATTTFAQRVGGGSPLQPPAPHASRAISPVVTSAIPLSNALEEEAPAAQSNDAAREAAAAATIQRVVRSHLARLEASRAAQAKAQNEL